MTKKFVMILKLFRRRVALKLTQHSAIVKSIIQHARSSVVVWEGSTASGPR